MVLTLAWPKVWQQAPGLALEEQKKGEVSSSFTVVCVDLGTGTTGTTPAPRYQAIVRLDCVQGQEYAGHLVLNQKDAEKSDSRRIFAPETCLISWPLASTHSVDCDWWSAIGRVGWHHLAQDHGTGHGFQLSQVRC